MARGPDGAGAGTGAGFSLADHLFNADSIGDLAREYAVLPGFDADAFLAKAVPGLEGRGLLERLDLLADCLEDQLPSAFPDMADALEAAMPPELDPTLKDDDFGRFIHAVPGILAVRHGLEDHRDRALALLHTATKRFSMEFYIRPFLNRWPDETLARLDQWAQDPNYHVRRLVSEGTRPKLPWAKNIDIDPMVPLRFLNALHADVARFVTRSVANHLNDITKFAPDVVTDLLARWREEGRQNAKELGWMTRHALRTAVKAGNAKALELLGYRRDLPVTASLNVTPNPVAIGDAKTVSATLTSPEAGPALVDYRVRFHRPSGKTAEKVFEIKQVDLKAGTPIEVSKRHPLKLGATTFTWHPGPHAVILQVNGRDVAEAQFEVVAPA